MQTFTIIAFFAGILLGAIACFALISRKKNKASIEQQLRELQEEFTAYRENVNTHFNKTAQMVNTLTENYIAVQKHLADAASSFAEPPKSFQLDTSNKLPHKQTEFVALETKEKEEKDTKDAEFNPDDVVQPPLDYAPKNQAKEEGTLSEEYGLHDTRTS